MRRHTSLAAALFLALVTLPLNAEDAALDLPLGDAARREKTLEGMVAYRDEGAKDGSA
jgi:hypothetical protein